MSDHVDPGLALALAALPEEDPERRAAWRHAAQCPACRALLDDGLLMLQLIDGARVEPRADAALKARVKAAVFARERRVRWELPALALFAVVSLLLALADGLPQRPLAVGIGMHCLLYEVALGMVPGGAMLLLARRGLVALQSLRMGALAAGFALLGQLLLRTRCPVHDAGAHLLVFHTGGVVLAAWLAATLVRFMPSRRS